MRPLSALIDGLAAQIEQIAGFAEVFRVPDEQHASRLQHTVDLLQDPALRGCIEIDHHVAAEDHVEGLAERPVVADQVNAHEFDGAPQLGLDPRQAGVRALAPQKELLEPFGA